MPFPSQVHWLIPWAHWVPPEDTLGGHRMGVFGGHVSHIAAICTHLPSQHCTSVDEHGVHPIEESAQVLEAGHKVGR